MQSQSHLPLHPLMSSISFLKGLLLFDYEIISVEEGGETSLETGTSHVAGGQ